MSKHIAILVHLPENVETGIEFNEDLTSNLLKILRPFTSAIIATDENMANDEVYKAMKKDRKFQVKCDNLVAIQVVEGEHDHN